MSSGTRSGLVDNSCPNFTKIGPSSSSALRRRSPRLPLARPKKTAGARKTRMLKGSFSLSKSKSKRYLPTTLTILAMRLNRITNLTVLDDVAEVSAEVFLVGQRHDRHQRIIF